MKISANAHKVLNSRYLLRDPRGNIIETPQQLFKRVAVHIAKAELELGGASKAEEWEEKFFHIMYDLKFLPNSPTLMNSGTNSGQLSACFVLPVEDTIEGIFTTLKNAALIHQSGGGTGFNFSSLRPRGDFISANSGSSSGPISFMKVFDAATGNIKQGGKRRGANMGILNIDHPDIEEFIQVKRSETELKNFNISVGMFDSFMQTLAINGEWELKHPSTRKVLKKIKAQDLWHQIVESAWASGDPGLIFLDTINQKNPTPSLGSIMSTNPCGEVPLLSYEACNLGSIDISKFVDQVTKDISWQELEISITTAIRFLDNVVEINDYILPEIRAVATGNRKIGLGIMGWADLLMMKEIPYASEEAIVLAKQVMKFISEKSEKASAELAAERGVFKNWEKSIYYPNKPLRNATRTSIAPTGTISIIANSSSSIEPLFALANSRKNVLDQETLSEINSTFVTYLKKNNLYSETLMEHVLIHGTIANTELPNEVKNLFKTALEIESIWHLKHQLAFQQFTDNAVSKTINLPQNATVNDVNNAYLMAWKEKAKGITVFRNGSKSEQVLHQGIQQNSCKVCKD
jgi:ribonucleoside-diphosphate reductase alpha chain